MFPYVRSAIGTNLSFDCDELPQQINHLRHADLQVKSAKTKADYQTLPFYWSIQQVEYV